MLSHIKVPILVAALCLVSLVSATFAHPQQAGADVATLRAQHLRHGINASMWFAQAPHNYSKERLQTYTTADDIALIARMGFDHVRLSIDADPLVEWQRSQNGHTDFMTELDRVVKTMVENHLAVIIDIHPESSYKAPLRQGTNSVQHFTALWRQLATHYASSDPEYVFFEIMNEPEQDDPYRWQGIQAVVAEAIHDVAPNHTIIAGGAHWSGLEDLLMLQPLAQANVIYTFHDYEPFPFTHQGATWTSPEVQPLRAIPYPSSTDAVSSKLDQEPELAGKYFLEQYGLGRWDADRVEKTIEFAAKWSQLHHAPVYCGEFGVLRDYAPPAMRAAWLRDMRTAMEKNNIGWAMWDYQANFGAVTKSNGVTTPDVKVINALGLHATAK
jgi:endoglucanase